MSEFQKILVPADFSENSRQAYRVACSLARADKTRILLLNVVEPQYDAPETVYFGDQTVPFTLVERAPEYYDALRERMRQVYAARPPLEVEYQTSDGHPKDVILRAARELGCQLIVMGTHGRTGLDRLLTGSVAEHVIRKAQCPVLALHARGVVSTAGTDTTSPVPEADVPSTASSVVSSGEGEETFAKAAFRRILHPTDFSESSDAALDVARSLAREQNAHLVILHVIATESLPIGVPPMPIDRALIRTSLREREIGADGTESDSTVESQSKDGDPAEEIDRVARESRCDLIVMGTHGRSGLGRLFMGSVAESVLRRTSCPVLIVKATRHDSISEPGETHPSAALA